MIKKILFLLFCISLISCEVQYEGNERLIAKTVIIDENGNPLKNIRVEINAETEYMSDNISYTITDENGTSLQLFPPLKSEGTYAIYINPDGDTYQSKSIMNIKAADFEDYIFDLGTITLVKNDNIANFSVNLVQLNSNNRIEDLSINAVSPEETIFYNEMEEEYEYLETSFRILKNQTFTLSYSVRNFGSNSTTVTEYTETIVFGNEDLTYIIEY